MKVVLSDMSNPTELSMQHLKRIVRYLVGRPLVAWTFDVQELPSQVVYECDSDWAEDRTTRRSTTSIFGYFGAHLLETQVASQAVVALSSGEAEFYAIGRAAASSILLRQFFEQCGVAVASVVASDSSAGRSIATRIGSGKVRHLQIRDLWVQERVRNKELMIQRVATEVNTSDLGTKYLDKNRMMKLMELAGLRPMTKGLAAGRA
jgi:hypothetical protein